VTSARASRFAIGLEVRGPIALARIALAGRGPSVLATIDRASRFATIDRASRFATIGRAQTLASSRSDPRARASATA
jgi:hypothetical protein